MIPVTSRRDKMRGLGSDHLELLVVRGRVIQVFRGVGLTPHRLILRCMAQTIGSVCAIPMIVFGLGVSAYKGIMRMGSHYWVVEDVCACVYRECL